MRRSREIIAASAENSESRVDSMGGGSSPLTGNTLTRKDFLKRAGVLGTALAGSPLIASGCGGHQSTHKRMNVILVILDSLRKDHVGVYDNDWIQTPTLDALARDSLRFTNAHPDAMPTIPARRAIHTGMRTFPFREWEHKGSGSRNYGWSSIPDSQTTLAEILKKEGYATALVTDTYHQFEMNFGRGFSAYRRIRGQESDPYRDPSIISEKEMRKHYLVNRSAEKARQYLANTKFRKSEADYFAPMVFTQASELLDDARRDQPFFLVADCYDPHEPWDPPDKYVSLYDSGAYNGKDPLYPRYGSDDYLTDEQVLRMRSLYSGEVTMADRWLGKFLQRAEEKGLMNNTLLLVISDHGHALGEHGYTGKPAFALWPELTDIVFMIRHPDGRSAGKENAFYASTCDIAPTILGFLGIQPPYPLEGIDLSPIMMGEKPGRPREHFSLAYKEYVWCRDERYVMFSRYDGTEKRLYDSGNDPEQTRDLAEDEPKVAQRMFEDYVVKDAGNALSEEQVTRPRSRSGPTQPES